MSDSGPWTERVAEVVRVADGRAWLRSLTVSECGACGARRACGSGALANWLRSRGRDDYLSVDNYLGAGPGDRVLIGVADTALVRAAARAYLVPLLWMLGGASVAAAAGSSDAVAVAAAALGLVVGLVAGQQHRRGGRNRSLEPRLLRVLTERSMVGTSLPTVTE